MIHGVAASTLEVDGKPRASGDDPHRLHVGLKPYE